MTIEEYRNKLYQYIQAKPLNRPVPSASAQQQNPIQQNTSSAHPKAESYLRANTGKAANSNTQFNDDQVVINNNNNNNTNSNNVNSELIEHYSQQKSRNNNNNNANNNYSSSYNTYESKSNNDINYQSDDNSATPTPPTPPPKSQLANYNQNISGSASANVNSAANNNNSNNNNYNRKKHPSDYQTQTNNFLNTTNPNSNLLGGVASYTGNFNIKYNFIPEYPFKRYKIIRVTLPLLNKPVYNLTEFRN